MKKVFAILLVLALVAGCVFAATNENHSIKIKADVTSIIPVFALQLNTPSTKVAITNSTSAPISDKTSSELYQYPNRFGLASNYDVTTAVDVKFNLDEGGEVLVSAMLLNPAKEISTYTFEFGDGVFTDTTVNGTLTPVEPTITPVSDSVVDEDGCKATITTVAATDSAETNKKISVVFDGKTVTAADTSSVTLVSAKYVYPATDVDLRDVSNNGGFYEATIRLTISTGN